MLSLWDLVLSLGRQFQNWAELQDTQLVLRIAWWCGEPHTHWNGQENLVFFHAAALSFPEDQGKIHSLRNFSSDLPSVLYASVAYSMSTLNSTYPNTDLCGKPPRKKNMTLLQCFISQWAALASIQRVKSETKTPFTALSSVVSYKSWQYHLQTSFKPVFFSSFLLPMQPYRCPTMSCLDHSSSFLSFLIASTQAPRQPLSTQLPELSFHL